MHGVYFHSSAALLSLMNMKNKNPESCLSFDNKIFQSYRPNCTNSHPCMSAGLLQHLAITSAQRGLPALMGRERRASPPAPVMSEAQEARDLFCPQGLCMPEHSSTSSNSITETVVKPQSNGKSPGETASWESKLMYKP